ncbi:Acetyltransferase (GNAT) domain-containing protein [Lysobacter sp. yr284]|uniref:GNAT family N-acetyltransferase n=1 Tax=Lysobacter TaxID=68 RepID=UPI00089D0D8E|nr:GNAT family N-acetyltransferase [Lysobacter sp. yr284]SDY90532.1 Acetyltransferase (GNAT) domain-containing protein [Lysobacter sp. yr284]
MQWIERLDAVDWDELSELYRIAPLGEKSPDYLRTAFGNSRYVVLVYADGRLVGAGRALADGVDCAYLSDIAVHPRHQGSGLGKAIVESLVRRAQGHRKILLYANPGKEGFYLGLGFKRMNTAMAMFADEAAALATGVVAAA